MKRKKKATLLPKTFLVFGFRFPFVLLFSCMEFLYMCQALRK